MAYCQDTDYLLLDEPLNNLDMYFASELMKSLRTIADMRDKTVVIVSTISTTPAVLQTGSLP